MSYNITQLIKECESHGYMVLSDEKKGFPIRLCKENDHSNAVYVFNDFEDLDNYMERTYRSLSFACSFLHCKKIVDFIQYSIIPIGWEIPTHTKSALIRNLQGNIGQFPVKRKEK